MTPLDLAKENNRAVNLAEYRSGKVKLSSRPRYLVVELTQTCNLHCPMCRPDQHATAGRIMRAELFDRVAAELFPLAEMVDLRGWGESLILPDIIKRIETTASYGVKIRFVSNLSFNRPKVLRALAEHGCYVAVSVDATDQSLFRELRGGANIEQVSANLKLLALDYQSRFGNTDHLHLTTTVQAPALRDLSGIVDFAADHGVREVRLFTVTVGPGSPLEIEDKKQEVDQALREATERARQRGIRLIAGTRLGSMPENAPGIPACIHPWAYAYISYRGAVGFCDHLVGIPGESYLIGDLSSSTFEDIWNGAAWQALRQEHLKERNEGADKFQECAWCYKNRLIDFEHYFDPEASGRIVFLNRNHV